MALVSQHRLVAEKQSSVNPILLVFNRVKRLFVRLILGLAVLAVVGVVSQAIAIRRDQHALPPVGQLIDVGGHRMHLYCTGAITDGNPTVILETGLGSTSSTWSRVQPEIARATRVCSYDRAGMGWSDAISEPRDAQHIAQELHGLLQSANVGGPYILVGWSYGGLYVQEYAGLYRDEVAGVVLLDSSSVNQWISTPEGQEQFATNARIYAVAPFLARLGVMRVMTLVQASSGLPMAEDGRLKASFAATKDWDTQSAEFLASLDTATQVRTYPSLENIPLFVLSATEHGTSPEQEQLWQAWQSELALLSTHVSHQVVEGADHASFWRDPTIVKASIRAILVVMDAAHNGTTLK